MGIRTRRARTHSNTHIVGFSLAGVLGFIALLAVTVALSLGALVSSWLEDLPDYTSADAYLVAEPTTVYDANGNEIASYYLQQRRSVDLSAISSYVVKGTVDTEDKRFYSHNGVDPQGIVRAVVVSFTGGSEGASTITQQLVRNTILSDEQFDHTLKRKVREAYLAIQMEKEYTKDQILNMYLNTIYYGNGAYGIEAASVTYFNKHASDLTLAEAATLIGLPQSPSYYDPTVNPDAAKERRNTVLDRMLEAGDITQEEHDAAQAEDLVLNEGELSSSTGTYPYFTDYVKQLLLKDFSSDTILQGGLKVYTTINPTYQAAAEDACNKVLDDIGNDQLGAALVSIDPDTGYIVAMVGGQDYSTSQYNLATSTNRQMGSSFKMFTLAAAINAGMNPSITLNCSSPMQITSTWKVKNFGNHNYGTQTLQSATAISSNTGYAQVAEAIGIDKVISIAHAMGVDTDLPEYLSVSLGSVGISAVEACEAYATLPAGGVHRDAVAITKIEDRNGNVVYQHEDSPTQAISEAVAEATTNVLKTVIADGGATGYYAHDYFDCNQPVAGKTGTSDNSEDLWFCAYTPQLCTVVWSGYPSSRTEVMIDGSTGTTQETVQPIWVDYMNTVLAGVAREEFPTTDEKVSYLPNSSWTFVGTSSSDNSDSVVETVTDETTTTTTTTTTPPTTDTGSGSGSGTGTGDSGSGTGGSGSGTGGSGSGSGSGSGTGDSGSSSGTGSGTGGTTTTPT